MSCRPPQGCSGWAAIAASGWLSVGSQRHTGPWPQDPVLCPQVRSCPSWCRVASSHWPRRSRGASPPALYVRTELPQTRPPIPSKPDLGGTESGAQTKRFLQSGTGLLLFLMTLSVTPCLQPAIKHPRLGVAVCGRGDATDLFKEMLMSHEIPLLGPSAALEGSDPHVTLPGGGLLCREGAPEAGCGHPTQLCRRAVGSTLRLAAAHPLLPARLLSPDPSPSPFFLGLHWNCPGKGHFSQGQGMCTCISQST